jgi:hypothetical protein
MHVRVRHTSPVAEALESMLSSSSDVAGEIFWVRLLVFDTEDQSDHYM